MPKSPFFTIHANDPQIRLIRQVVDVIRNGGLIIYPTDSCYALGCQIGNKTAMTRIQTLRQLDKSHNFTLMCRDLSEISTYAKVSNQDFRLMKSLTPNAYTFILPATHEVPKRLQNPKRKTIGLRIPNNAIVQAILDMLGEPIMSSTLISPNQDMPETEPDEIYEKFGKLVDLVIDGEHCGYQPTTVIELLGDVPYVVREGCAPIDMLS